MVLLFTPKFFNIDKLLTKEIRDLGYSVSWYNESLKLNVINSFIFKIFKFIPSLKFTHYINKIINNFSKVEVEKVILVFGGYFFTSKHILALKKSFPNAEFIYYNRDSIKNYPHILSFCNLFEVKYSFDRNDCEKYGFKFLPLFYTYKKTNSDVNSYYASSIMTYNSYKVKCLLNTLNFLPKNKNLFIYIFVPSKVKYFIIFALSVLKKNPMLRKYLHRNSLTNIETEQIFNSSQIILDFPLQNQNGLTIRTLDALYLHKKIITTNVNIKEYEFYCPENIYIFPNSSKNEEKAFFNSDFNTDYLLSDNYSIEYFVKQLLYNTKNNK